jgi:G3E family GTPase
MRVMRMTDERPPIPVNVLTGFLGSGKTTVLRRLLSAPAFANTAVLINEFGEIGLDHLLIERLDATTVLLESGCICCSMQEDLRAALKSLFSRFERRELARFDRVIIETSGLADPAPVLATVAKDPVLRYHFRLGNVIATVDAVNGPRNLDVHPEIRKQVAVADRILLTKVDLVGTEMAAVATARIAAINPASPLEPCVHGAVDAASIIGRDAFDSRSKIAEVQGWIDRLDAHQIRESGEHADGAHESTEAIGHESSSYRSHGIGTTRTVAITLSEPVEWAAFGLWLSLLLKRHGDQVLRVKGIVNIEGSCTPVVVHGVQSLLHSAEHLSRWPTGSRDTRLVLIVQKLEPAMIERSLRTFLRLGTRAATASNGWVCVPKT